MFNLFRRSAPQAAVSPVAVPLYPAPPDGLPVSGPDAVLQTQSDMVSSLHQTLGWARPRFDELVMPCLHRFVAYAHLLPADESHHNAAGGLLAHALATAFFAVRASEGAVFAMDREPKIRRELEPRYRFATLLAGLLIDAGKPLTTVAVKAAGGETTWNPYLATLPEWATDTAITHYQARWRASSATRRHEGIALMLVREIAGAEGLRYLTEFGYDPLEALQGALLGQSSATNPITDLVMLARNGSIEEDLRRSSQEVGGTRTMESGHAFLNRILRAMRALVRTEEWKPNQKGQPLWLTNLGLHLQWPEAGVDIVRQLRAEGDRTLPDDPTLLLGILLEYRLIARFDNDDGGSDTWTLYPPRVPDSPAIIALTTVRLARGDILFETGVPALQPITVSTQRPAVPTPSEPAATSPAPTAVAPPSNEKPAPPKRARAKPTPVAPATPQSGELPLATTSASTATPPSNHVSPAEENEEEDTADDEVATSDADIALPTIEEIEATLEAAGRAGDTLLAVLQDIDAGVRIPTIEKGTPASLTYPRGVTGLGTDPEIVVRLFREAGWLADGPNAPDADQPLRFAAAPSSWIAAYAAAGRTHAREVAHQFVANLRKTQPDIEPASIAVDRINATTEKLARDLDLDSRVVGKRLLQSGLVVKRTGNSGKSEVQIDLTTWNGMRGE